MKKALLVIDMQNGLTHKKKLYCADEFMHTINRAVDIFRTAGDPVVFVQHNSKLLPEGTEDWQLDTRLFKEPDDPVFQKSAETPFLPSA